MMSKLEVILLTLTPEIWDKCRHCTAGYKKKNIFINLHNIEILKIVKLYTIGKCLIE